MKIRINNIILPPGFFPDEEVAAKAAGLECSAVKKVNIVKQSVDARRKNNIQFVYSIMAELCEGVAVKETNDVRVVKEQNEQFETSARYEHPPVIAGMGPAGLFCGYILAKHGYNPVIIEQGRDVEQRTADVDRFKSGGKLNTLSNIQFGEGGAGTFSDGKLTTRINDFYCDTVLGVLHQFGAPEDILYKAKPHVGTDILKNVVKNIRMEIIRLGGKVLFETKLEEVFHNGRISGIKINGQEIPCEALVLAIGHSARDTFEMLMRKGVFMEPKAFAMGVRIEHTQEFINYAQYGNATGKYGLDAAEYFLKYNGKNHSCYSFCMCPGGEIVPAASEDGGTVTNGMSCHARDGKFANSGIVVTVSPEDFGKEPLSGMHFQRTLEQKAFEIGGCDYTAPAQNCGDFFAGKPTSCDPVTTYSRGTAGTDLHLLFPEFMTKTLEEGLKSFDRKIPGFAGNKVPLVGIESRTSSPLKITRGEDMQSVSVKGLYPCGEGAGYAGGIMSAAVDGIRIAKQIMSNKQI